MQTYLIIALVSYLLGSIPFGYILVRLFLKQDIRETGSGNIGATNVARSGAKGLAVATLLLDAAKGFLAVVLGGMFFLTDLKAWGQLYADTQMVNPNGPPVPAHIVLGTFIAGLSAILGHMFPIWLRFRGGKGVATAVGVFLGLAPAALLVAFLCFAAIVALTRYVSLGSVVAALVFPFAAYVWEPELRTVPLMLILSICSLLIILKHHANIRRLLAGTEPKLGAKPTVPSPDQMEKQA